MKKAKKKVKPSVPVIKETGWRYDSEYDGRVWVEEEHSPISHGIVSFNPIEDIFNEVVLNKDGTLTVECDVNIGTMKVILARAELWWAYSFEGADKPK